MMNTQGKTIKAVIFDLDGTLLDTLADLTDSVNYALRTFGHSPASVRERGIEEIRRFVGNGVRNLMKRALPEDTDEQAFEEAFAIFRTHYMEHCQDKTRPYEGIMELLRELKRMGIRMAIVSNKLQPAVEALRARYFDDLIKVAIGESREVRRKPAPDAILLALQRLGCSREEAIYVGDSEVDIATAQAAGLPCISVTWGFRERALLESCHPHAIATTPHDILPSVDAQL